MLLFACGLMAKPMVVTLPFALLLVDVWPLKRAAIDRAAGWGRLILEKLPLVALAAAVGVATVVLQRGQGALPALDAIPLTLRAANALISYVSYIGLMFWPAHLAALYPYPRTLPPWWAIAGAALILTGVSGVAIRTARRHPYVLVGWLWYLGTLVPVIGLIQSGEQSMADRFVYIPLVGLFVIVAWGFRIFWRAGRRRVALPAAAAIAIVACAIVSRNQVQILGRQPHALGTRRRGDRPQLPRAGQPRDGAQDAGRTSDAIAHYSEALRINPRFVDAYDNLGLALASEGRTAEASSLYAETLRLKPTDADAHNNLGKILAEQGKVGDAVAHFSEAVRLRPQFSTDSDPACTVRRPARRCSRPDPSSASSASRRDDRGAAAPPARRGASAACRPSSRTCRCSACSSSCAITWLVNDADITKLGWPVAQPRFSRRPSASTITLWPSGSGTRRTAA